MKKMPPKTIKSIYREANGYPVTITISSNADFYKLLGYVNLKATQIDEDMVAVSHENAYADDEPLCITDFVEEDGVIRTKYIYGDVIIVGYDPEQKEFTSLNSYQLSRYLFTPEDLE